LNAVEILKSHHPDIEVVIPTLPQFKDQIKSALKGHGISGYVTTDEMEKYEAMRASTAALAASGTVTLELGLCDTPMVVAYKGNPISAAIVRKLILTKHVSLANILLEKEVVPELLQEACKSEDLSHALHKLLKDKSESHGKQKKELSKLRALVETECGGSPSDVAAQAIFETLFKK
jgi:lipid-A-disaccharide synthase